MPELKRIYSVGCFNNGGGIIAEGICSVCGCTVLGKLGFGVIVKVKREDLDRRLAV